MRDSQYTPPAAISAPATMSGGLPVRGISPVPIPAEIATISATGTYARPARMGEKPSTFCM